jgi:hypothetical protein
MVKSASAPSVEAFLDVLVHARKPTVLALYGVIRGAVPDLGEEIKWNAPSFIDCGEHRLTMRLQPKNVVQLIFHRGAKARQPVDLSSVDVTGRIKWAASDRGVLDIVDGDPFFANPEALQDLIREWLAATALADGIISKTTDAS